MIRRFNFTGRKKLPHALFDIRLQAGPPRQFTATFDISEYQLPPNARLYFEASSSGSGIVSRFSWGTASVPAPPEDRSLEELPGQNVNFTFKVVDESESTGRILAVARGIGLNRAAEGDGDRRQSLLPVNPVAMSQEIWRVSFQQDTPWLEVNSDIEDIMVRAQGDPVFVSLVYPAVVREILTEALMIRGVYDVEDTEKWESRWLSFGQRFHPDLALPPEVEDADTQREWIEQGVKGFSSYYTARDRFVSVPASLPGSTR